MGDYAHFNGESIKIGTAGDMYYLRFDQIRLIEVRPGDVDPIAVARNVRFRFPFPNEDTIAPGEFEDYGYALGVNGVEVPEGIEHRKVQFKDTRGRGLLALTECPMSDVGKLIGGGDDPIVKFAKNGYSGDVRIAQQRIWDDKLVTVCQCGGCGAAYRLETFEMAEPLVVALRSKGDREDRSFWHTMADRVTAGYMQTVDL
jgi:hypothetical protein